MNLEPGLRENLLQQLEGALDRTSREVSNIVPPDQEKGKCQNVCGSCLSCCTARGSMTHRVTDMEFELIKDRISDEVSREFRRYIERERIGDQIPANPYVYETCPNYDPQKRGCRIYQHRPFACRVFGHLRPHSTLFPSGCHFEGHEKVFGDSDYFAEVPRAREIRRLSREFQMCKPPLAAHYVDLDHPNSGGVIKASNDTSKLDPSDNIDRSMILQQEGQFDEALSCLLEERKQLTAGRGQESYGSPSLYLDFCIAMLLTRMEQHEPALAVYASLLDHLPERADLRYYAGYHALHLGQREIAQKYFAHTVAQLPNHSLALGFLGYMHLQDGELKAGRDFLELAANADPDNPFFQFRLGCIYQQMDGREAGLENLRRAANHPATREQALRALTSSGSPL